MNDKIKQLDFTKFPDYKKKVKVLKGKNVDDLKQKEHDFMKDHTVINMQQPWDTILFIFYVE